MNEEVRALAREVLGFEPPPQGIRHFLPPLDQEAMRNPRMGLVHWITRGEWLFFEGYEDANLLRYICSNSTGDCLTPDFPYGTTDWFDPQLSVRPGDIGLILIRVPGLNPHVPHHCVKQFQERNGRPWACCNEGDFPLSERTQLCGRLVMTFVPDGGKEVRGAT
jgi:hypothetical protein